MTESIEEPVVTESLRQLYAELVLVQAKARDLGLFVGDRPLLDCPDCRLAEDVTAEGLLVVYTLQELGGEAAPGVTRDWDIAIPPCALSP